MARTPPEIAARMIAQLRETAPGLSLERGTPERKIVDAAAEAISEAHVDQYLVGSLLDIETKVGLELEQFVGIFGYGRLQGRAAEGVVRVTLATPAPQDYEIPLGSQFYTRGGIADAQLSGHQPLYFASTEAVVLTAGSHSVDVPVRCTIVGTIGNVPPDTITYLGSVIGSGSATNLTSLTGGVNTETDTELRQRFKDTFLRNITGTADYYKSLCLQNNRVSRAAVYGVTMLYRTQIEVPSTTLALPVGADVKYVWPDMHSCFANLAQDDEVFYSPIYDYSLSSGSSPVFTRNPAGSMEIGEIVDLELQYTPTCSRNDPVNGITNKIDAFVDGIDPTPVTEKTVVSGTALSSSPASPFYVGNFERVGSLGSPSSGNRFMLLGSVPIVTFPATIVVGDTAYQQGVHYHVLRDTTLRAGSPSEVSGIEWTDAGPSNDTELTLSYIYNRVPEVLSHVMAHAKQVGSDVMVHQAKFRYIRPCLSVQYDRSYTVSVINAAIEERLKALFAGMSYGAHIRASTITMAAQQASGVLDVKLTTGAESPTDYGMQLYHNANDPAPTTVHTDDFKLGDDSLPIFLETKILRKAAS